MMPTHTTQMAGGEIRAAVRLFGDGAGPLRRRYQPLLSSLSLG